MAVLTVNRGTLTGVAPAPVAAAAGGDSFPVGSETIYLRFVNANAGGSRTITIDDPNTTAPEGATAFNADLTVTVPASSTRLVKLTNPARFKGAATGRASMTYSANADLTIEVFV